MMYVAVVTVPPWVEMGFCLVFVLVLAVLLVVVELNLTALPDEMLRVGAAEKSLQDPRHAGLSGPGPVM